MICVLFTVNIQKLTFHGLLSQSRAVLVNIFSTGLLCASENYCFVQSSLLWLSWRLQSHYPQVLPACVEYVCELFTTIVEQKRPLASVIGNVKTNHGSLKSANPFVPSC